MGYDRNDRRHGRDQSYGYRPQGSNRDYERGYDRGEDLSYNRDRGYGGGDYSRGRVDYGRPPQGFDPDERGFFDRAGDEVRSWFGDEEAERRRRYDERMSEREERSRGRESQSRESYGRETSGRSMAYGEAGGGLPSAGYGWSFRDQQGRDQQGRDQQGRDQQGRDRQGSGGERGQHHDPSYRSWRDRQIEALDRDYDDYRRENQSKFENEFGGWRNRRQGQRDSLQQVQEHQEVVGSDGAHVGKVDHVRGDHILLAKNDQDAGGHHHSIPSSWIVKVGDTVQIDRTAEQAKKAWKDEDANKAIGGQSKADERGGGESQGGARNLNRSFSGTY